MGSGVPVFGVIWLQGESDSTQGHDDDCQQLLTALTTKVRAALLTEKLPNMGE